MNISNSLSQFLNSIKSSHSEHIVFQTLLYPVSTHILPVGRKYAILDLTMSLIEAQGSMCTASASIIELTGAIAILLLFMMIFNRSNMYALLYGNPTYGDR